MIQRDEAVVTVTVVGIEENPPSVMLVHDTVGARGAKRRITQKVAVPDPELFARLGPFKLTGEAAKAVIVTEWREEGVQNYLRDFIPDVESRTIPGGAGSNGTLTSDYSTPVPTKLPSMVKEK